MDSIIVFPPGASGAGSQLQLGTYLMWDPGANYGAQGLLQSLRSANALSDGGRFAFRYAPVRQMAIPLLLRDVPGQTLLQTESLLREWTTAGAYVAIQPETVPSGQAVFFDILDGRWEPDYNGFENRAGRRKGTLFLDTQPFGYWPTEILLASAASIGFFGSLAINAPASLIGDVSPLAHILVNPTAASSYPSDPVGSGWAPDMVAISLGGRASFLPFVGASSFPSYTPVNGVASLTADKYAAASVARIITQLGAANQNWTLIADTGTFISSAIEPAYRGRFRVFAFAKIAPSTLPWSMIVDADRFVATNLVAGAYAPFAMASANQLATVYNYISAPGITAAPAYSILDMGEVTLPPQASGFQTGVRLRAWTQNPPSYAGTTQLSLAGLYLLPVDGAAGILTRGLYTPSIFGGVGGIAEWNRSFVDSVNILGRIPGTATPQAVDDGRDQYRGVSPRLGATTQQLLVLTGDRQVGNYGGGGTYPVVNGNWEYSQVSVSYRPNFQFLYGI
jgi:hypothetical protein